MSDQGLKGKGLKASSTLSVKLTTNVAIERDFLTWFKMNRSATETNYTKSVIDCFLIIKKQSVLYTLKQHLQASSAHFKHYENTE